MAQKVKLNRRDFENGTSISGSGRAKAIDVHAFQTESGVDAVKVNNGDFSFVVLATRGMSIWKAWAGDEPIGWKSPVQGPVHPSWVPVSEPSGLGWLDGFDELLVRCGLESNGAPEFKDDGTLLYPLHGRIGNKPAVSVEVEIDDDAGSATVRGVVDETRFHFLKTRLHAAVSTTAGESSFRIRDRVENLSASPAEIQMLYHVNFGVPLLDGGSQVVAPIQELVPRNQHAADGIAKWNHYEAEQAGFEEQVYFATLRAGKGGRTEVLLKNAHGTRGVSLQYPVENLPCFTVWKNTTAVQDGYVTGLEPGTNYPNPRSYEGQQGRVASLKGGASVEFDLQLMVHTTGASLEQAEKRVAQIAGAADPVVHDQPQKGWCSDA